MLVDVCRFYPVCDEKQAENFGSQNIVEISYEIEFDLHQLIVESFDSTQTFIIDFQIDTDEVHIRR